MSLTFCMFCKTHFRFKNIKCALKGVPFEVIVITDISRNLFMFWCMRMKMIRKTILYQYKPFYSYIKMEIPFQSIVTPLTNRGISYLFIKLYFYKHVNPKKYLFIKNITEHYLL